MLIFQVIYKRYDHCPVSCCLVVTSCVLILLVGGETIIGDAGKETGVALLTSS